MPHVMNTYARLPAACMHGEVGRLYDEAGRRHPDALPGIAFSTPGRSRRRALAQVIVKASACHGRSLATPDATAAGEAMAPALFVGEVIRTGMAAALQDEDGLMPGVVDIRGRGLMLEVELDRPCAVLVGRALEAGLLINVTAERVLRLLPAVTFSIADAEALVALLAPLIRDFLSQG
jgi:acetylornithine/succinyldiaminopimelate/putrescine aminotransferase